MKGEMKPWIPICPGIKRRTVASGSSMYQMLAQLEAGSVLPEHRHAQEQIVHVVQGHVRLIVAGVPHELRSGDTFYLESNVPHGAETVDETTIIDTFTPPREDLLALDQQAISSTGR